MAMSLFYERYPLSRKPDPSILTPCILRRAQIGERYWGSTLESIPEKYSHRWYVQWYVNNLHEFVPSGLGLVFSGKFGTGKTALGCILLKEVLMRGGRCLHIQCAAMIDRLWSHTPSLLPNGAPLSEGLENVTLLFLDDFEFFEKSGTVTSAKDRTIERIIRHRYEHSLPTIIATNIEWEKLLNKESYLSSLMKDRYYGVSVAGINWRESPPDVPNSDQ